MTALVADMQFETEPPDEVSGERIQSWLDACFPDLAEQTIVVRVTHADESAALNAEYRGKAGPTNVLSFPFEAPPGIPVDHLGDLVICVPVVMREAVDQGKTAENHFAHMIVHGVLHLLGHDHLSDEEAERMESLEIELLARIGVANPYV